MPHARARRGRNHDDDIVVVLTTTMWHCRGSLHAIRAHTMVFVRAVMPVRGVVHGQTASSFGWKGLKPEPNRDDVTSSRP
ncbi:MAG TPA: hypothetical protein VE888_05575 [Streptosporangiaceae bacterium]|nr:hypothetical protein [Streptosporangiaceae bacterium]